MVKIVDTRDGTEFEYGNMTPTRALINTFLLDKGKGMDMHNESVIHHIAGDIVMTSEIMTLGNFTHTR